MKVPLCSTGLCSLQGCCPASGPASSHFNSQSCKVGHRVSLTIYCPWATCCVCVGSMGYGWGVNAPTPGSNSSLKTQNPASRLKTQPQGSKSSLKAQNLASRLNIQLRGSKSSPEAHFPTSRLNFQPQASKLTKHRSLAPSGPAAPLTKTHIYSQRGNRYR